MFNLGDVAVKIKSCGVVLADWNKTEFRHVHTKIRKKECELGLLFEQVRNGNLRTKIDECRADLRNLKV